MSTTTATAATAAAPATSTEAYRAEMARRLAACVAEALAGRPADERARYMVGRAIRGAPVADIAREIGRTPELVRQTLRRYGFGPHPWEPGACHPHRWSQRSQH